jgi:hypothetical protein
MRLLRKVRAEGYVFVRGEDSFRDVQRLHEAGLVTAAVSRHNLFGRKPRRPFRELAVFATVNAALDRYPTNCILPRKTFGGR